MNQAVEYAGGEYFLFLNCGDYLMDEKVLESVKQALEEEQYAEEYPKKNDFSEMEYEEESQQDGYETLTECDLCKSATDTVCLLSKYPLSSDLLLS